MAPVRQLQVLAVVCLPQLVRALQLVPPPRELGSGHHRVAVVASASALEAVDDNAAATKPRASENASCGDRPGGAVAPQQASATMHVVTFLKPSSQATGGVKRIWRWKEALLGDGHDMFEPKPK